MREKSGVEGLSGGEGGDRIGDKLNKIRNQRITEVIYFSDCVEEWRTDVQTNSLRVLMRAVWTHVCKSPSYHIIPETKSLAWLMLRYVEILARLLPDQKSRRYSQIGLKVLEPSLNWSFRGIPP